MVLIFCFVLLVLPIGNVPPDKVLLAGDSAGGNLVLSLLYILRQLRMKAAKRRRKETMQRELEAKETNNANTAMEQTDVLERDSRMTLDLRRSGKSGSSRLAIDWQDRRKKSRHLKCSSAGNEIVEEQVINVKINVSAKKIKKSKDKGGYIDIPLATEEKEKEHHDTNEADAEEKEEAKRKEKQKVEGSSNTQPHGQEGVTDKDDDEEEELCFDEELYEAHRIPFQIEQNFKNICPPFPGGAVLISPWLDLTEASSVHEETSYQGREKWLYQPYHLGARFALAYKFPTLRSYLCINFLPFVLNIQIPGSGGS